MELDGVDGRLISLLRQDGRLTYKALGEAVGYTIMGVKRRVERLLEEDVIHIAALENVRKLGYHAAFLLLEIGDRETLREMLRRFEGCPRVIYLFTLLAGYNLAALVIAENLETLESEAWERCSLRSHPGIRRSEFYPIGEIYYSPHLPVRVELMEGDAEEAPCGVNCGACERYRAERCLGCPATRHYRGR
ncbi:MAG: AsnC family transcriptional regulator [Candidatus Bathyarchaeota archaeon B23]|nr:MAG: AsnC family transcriptional regulator [Candidatus Bathyarchaeota archaeon B23]